MTNPIQLAAVERRTEVRRLYQQGLTRGAIVARLRPIYGVSSKTIDNDLAVVQREITEDGKSLATQAREILSAGYWEIFRAAMGHDIAEVSSDLLVIAGDALDESERAADALRARYPHLRRRDLTAAVGALREIGKLHGAYAPERREVSHSTGVLLIPGSLTVDEWKAKHLPAPTGEVIDAEWSEALPAPDLSDADW